MITTMRQTNTTTLEKNNVVLNVDLLQKQNKTEENVNQSKEAVTQTREKMQKNLADLLNYDRLKEVEGQEKQENKDVKSSQDEDIRPSSTTMQFGDDNLSNVMMDLDRQKKHEEEKNTLYLNKKGKLLLVLYSLTVAVIMALIVLNTNLLTVLNKNNVAKAEVLESKIAEFNEINAEINSVTSNEHVINVAEQEYGMIIK